MSSNSRNSGQVRSLVRALSILKNLAASADGMSLTEISEATGLPPSTTHRLLTTLEGERFVRADPSGGLWRVGVAAFFVGSAFARNRNIQVLARPYMRRLMEVCGETSNLFVESNDEVVCIGQIESRHAMRAITGVGGRVMMHSSAAGKAMLAHVPSARRAKLLERMDLQKTTENTISTREGLLHACEKVRVAGYAVDDEEHALGVRCVSAPIFNEFGDVIAALSVSGPMARMPDERLPLLGKMVAQAAEEATRDFCGMPVPMSAVS